jgi:hypothetical protein
MAAPLIGHLKKVRGYAIEERSPGIYTVTGDIIPIQVIDNRKLPGDEDIWLKNLDNTLDAGQINQLMAEREQLEKTARVGAYFDVISRANTEKAKEAYEMRKKTMGFVEILKEIGVIDEIEAQVEARVEARVAARVAATKALEVAKNLITRIGLPLEQVAEATGLDLETVQSLVPKAV